MTPKQEIAYIRKTFTKRSDLAGGSNAYLMVGSQTFIILKYGTKKEAEWFRDMLAIALHRMAGRFMAKVMPEKVSQIVKKAGSNLAGQHCLNSNIWQMGIRKTALIPYFHHQTTPPFKYVTPQPQMRGVKTTQSTKRTKKKS